MLGECRLFAVAEAAAGAAFVGRFAEHMGEITFLVRGASIDYVALAKGPIPIRTMLSRVYVIREIPTQPGKYQRIQANFVRFIRNGDSAQNVELQPGDLVYVSETRTPDIVGLSNILANAIFIVDRIRFH